MRIEYALPVVGQDLVPRRCARPLICDASRRVEACAFARKKSPIVLLFVQ